MYRYLFRLCSFSPQLWLNLSTSPWRRSCSSSRWSSPPPPASGAASAPSSTKSSNQKKTPASTSSPSARASGTSSGKSSARPRSSASARSPASPTPSSSGDSAPLPWSRSTTSPSASASASSIPQAPIGRFYFYFAAVFALACAVGIFGLFVRRFLVRPNWLGEKLSCESGFIALLIFVLMVTYLAAFFVADAEPGRARSLVDSHPRPARLSAHHSPHQAPAPGSQPGHRLSLPRRLQPDPAARRR